MHLSRKLFHATGVGIVVLYHHVPIAQRTMVLALWGAVAILLLVDLARWKIPAVQALFRASFRAVLEPKDTKGLNTSTLYHLGCALTVTLFSPVTACAGILALALGDPAAAIVGSSVRSPRLGSRVSVAGSLACVVAAAAGIACFLPWPKALLGGVAAAVLEACSGSKLDNLTIPVGTAAVLYLL